MYILAYVYAIILESIKQGLFKHIPALGWVVWIFVLPDDYMHMYIYIYIYIYIYSAPKKDRGVNDHHFYLILQLFCILLGGDILYTYMYLYIYIHTHGVIRSLLCTVSRSHAKDIAGFYRFSPGLDS